MREEIRSLIQRHGRLGVDVDVIGDDADLYDAGLTSHACITVMLALESHFDVEFPERLLRRRTFESIISIRSAIQELSAASVHTT